MLSMLRWLSDCQPGMDVAFINSALRPEDKGGISDHDIAGGNVLACCARPLSSPEIEA